MERLLFTDNQLHSTYSDGSFSLEEIFEYNRVHHRLDLTITDHVDKNTRWFPRYAAHIKRLRKTYPEFSVSIGCEVKILDDGTLNTTPEILAVSERVLGSVHHFDGIMQMAPAELLQREYELTQMLASHPDIDILAHPFSMGMRFHKSSPPLAWVKDIYERCAKAGIRFEYNHKNAPQSVRAFVRELVARGETKHLSFGSDMHKDLSELGRSGFAMLPTTSVLVTGAGAGVGQSIIKALKLSSLPLRIIAADYSPLAAGLYAADVAYTVPKFHEKSYISRVITICRKERAAFLFPGTDVELEVLSLNKKKIEQATGTIVIVSPVRAVRIADDKWKTVQFLKTNRFPYPASCLPKELQRFLKTASFPLIVKPRVGARSIGLHVVHTREELDRAITATPGAVIQEYLSTENHEYSCSAFFYGGKNYGVIAGKRWLRNGDTYKALFKKNPALERFIAKVGERLGAFGSCNFQLRMTKRGPVIFEINCRFSGTTGAISALGFNAANALVEILRYGRKPSPLGFRQAYMFRYWNEIFTQEKHVKELGERGKLEAPSSETNIF